MGSYYNLNTTCKNAQTIACILKCIHLRYNIINLSRLVNIHLQFSWFIKLCSNKYINSIFLINFIQNTCSLYLYVCVFKLIYICSSLHPFDIYGAGIKAIDDYETKSEMEDRIHHFCEECDSLQVMYMCMKHSFIL